MGAKPGGMKGNEQEAEYEEAEGKHGKPGGTEAEESGGRKAKGQHRRRPTVRGKREERGKEETEAK